MSNIKANNKVFRDVEKMSLEQLHEVRVALVTEQQKIVLEGQRLIQTNSTQKIGRIGQLNARMEEIKQRLDRVDQLAKPLAKADVSAKLANMDALADVNKRVADIAKIVDVTST